MDKKLIILNALADETRLSIITFLIGGEKCVCEIWPHVKKTQSTVSIHLDKLQKCGILESKRRGKNIFYKIKDKRIYKVLKVLH